MTAEQEKKFLGELVDEEEMFKSLVEEVSGILILEYPRHPGVDDLMLALAKRHPEASVKFLRMWDKAIGYGYTRAGEEIMRGYQSRFDDWAESRFGSPNL